MADSLNRKVRALVVYWTKRARLSIRTLFIGFILLATVMTATVAISFQYLFSRNLAVDTTLKLYEISASDTQAYLAELDKRAASAVKLLAKFSRFDNSRVIHSETQALFAEAMLRNPLFHAIYIGFDNGDYYGIVNLEADPITRTKLDAQPEDRWVITHIYGADDKRQRVMQFADAKFNVRETHTQTTAFKTQYRPWFADVAAGEVHKTQPYLFQQLQVPGETYSTRNAKGNAVMAVDITLSSISQYLVDQDFGDSTEMYLFKDNGDLIASNQTRPTTQYLPEAPQVTFTEAQQALIDRTPYIMVSSELDWPPISFAASGWPYGYAIDVMDYFSQVTGIEVRYVNGLPWKHLAEMFLQGELDVLQPVYFDPSRSWLGELSKTFLEVPYGVITPKGQRISHINELKGKTVAIPEGWLLAANLEEQFPQLNVVRVPTVRAMFDAVSAGEVDAAVDTAPILNYIADQYFIDDVSVSSPIDFGDVNMPKDLHFMVNRNQPELAALFDHVLAHLKDGYKTALENKWFNTQLEQSVERGAVPYKPLVKLAQQGGSETLVQRRLDGTDYYTYVIPFRGEHGQKEFLAIATPVDDVLAAGLDKVKQAVMLTLIALVFIIPVVWWLSEFLFSPIRKLADDSKHIAHRRYDRVTHTDSNIAELHDLAISMEDMSEAIQEHEQAQQNLMDALIKLIAQAIDDKSAHTAGHCERVPQLALMLARQAHEANEGSFAEFALETEEAWREFEVGAWLHDCGKITTPEHIIDKGTKLETIYNRIHEVRMRFEVLWRDAEIHYLTALIEPDADAEALEVALKQRQQQLTDDFAFIASVNIGGEFMRDEDIERVKNLAAQEWQRHFDDRLGLSHIELMRYADEEQQLPVTERLLDDKAHHVIPRTRNTDFDPALGIKMTIPENLYNLGEVYNLIIQRGTLTAEDRFKINEHIISTIRMLENLPFPEEMQQVPRYASTHHETVKGTGYPRQLKGDELSIPERVMVLADIYEALTAADRPYKKAKPISEAIKILSFMVKDEHVDREVFELFLRSGVYLDYAKAFLPEAQIDEVDINDYL